MKKAIVYLLTFVVFMSTSLTYLADAQGKGPKSVHVKGYTTKSGKHVSSHMRSAPHKH